MNGGISALRLHRGRVVLAMCLMTLFHFGGVAEGQVYHVLGVPLISGTKESAVVSIDKFGRVAGTFTTDGGDRLGYRYPILGGNFDVLNPLPGDVDAIVNDHGYVGITCGMSDNTPVTWFNNGPAVEIAPGEGVLSATGTNFIGKITGSKIVSLFEAQAYLWSQNGGMQILGTLGTGEDSVGADVNANSQVTGWSEINPGGVPRAFKWDAVNGMIDLGTLNNYQWSMGVAINDNNVVLAHAINIIPSKFRSFLWENGVRTEVPQFNGNNTTLRALNNHGQAVGQSFDGFKSIAILYYDGRVVNLNSMILPNIGWELTVATGINDEGLICGDGLHNGVKQAWVLKPNYSNGAIVVPSATEKKAYVFDPEEGNFLGAFGTSFADWGIEIIDSKPVGPAASLLMSDNIGGVVHQLHADGSRSRDFSKALVPGIRGIAKSVNDFYVGVTPSGFVAWDEFGNELPDSVAGNFMDIIMIELPNQRYYVMTEIDDDNIEGYKLSLNFVGQSRRNGIPGGRQLAAAFKNKYYLVAGFDTSRVYGLKVSNAASVGSFAVNGKPQGVIQLDSGKIMVSTSTGVHIYSAGGQFLRTIVSRGGMQYLNRCMNYQPF